MHVLHLNSTIFENHLNCQALALHIVQNHVVVNNSHVMSCQSSTHTRNENCLTKHSQKYARIRTLKILTFSADSIQRPFSVYWPIYLELHLLFLTIKDPINGGVCSALVGVAFNWSSDNGGVKGVLSKHSFVESSWRWGRVAQTDYGVSVVCWWQRSLGGLS